MCTADPRATPRPCSRGAPDRAAARDHGCSAFELQRGHHRPLVLRILSAGPLHGYAIIAALKDRSDGLFDLPEGTVYPSLHRLEDAGMLTSDWDTAGGRRRRRYRLAPGGTVRLAAGRRNGRGSPAG